VNPPSEELSANSTRRPGFGVGGLVKGAVVLGLLYFGREVLVPITLALLLSLLLAPLVRRLRRLVRSQVVAVLGAVIATALLVGVVAAAIVTHMVTMAATLPQYETTIRDKIKVVQDMTLGRMTQDETGRMMSRLRAGASDASMPVLSTPQGAPLTASGAVPVVLAAV
jgi:predicted PurR-regulated permease PerM